ncbi:hypothetical protein Ae707Ps1_2835 [Pseudonocardia sp. Ae707_Ps1]|nr:hypothetical protein Ae707Ps1_2835 [Pseudonocardia sp. Ae707_Ps1]
MTPPMPPHTPPGGRDRPVSAETTDRTGAAVTIALRDPSPVGSFVITLGDGPEVGRADFLDPPGAQRERIFFHTEVDADHGSRGLAGLVVREALADSIRRDLIVVPVCPLFARHLRSHGEEFTADGGRFRRPTRDDVDLVTRTVRDTP